MFGLVDACARDVVLVNVYCDCLILAVKKLDKADKQKDEFVPP